MMMNRRMGGNVVSVLLALGCLVTVMSGCASAERTSEDEKIAEVRKVMGEPDVLRGRLLDTGKLFGGGKLYLVRTGEIIPRKRMCLLEADEWHGMVGCDDETKRLSMCPPRPEFTLLLADGKHLAYVEDITDLRWKVKIETEEDAARFADLVGLPETAGFFADCRGWEVRKEGESTSGYCELSPEKYEEIGLPLRSIKRVYGGFLIRRPLYVEATKHEGRRIIISSEFVSHDGFYLLAVEKEIAKGDECPVFVLILDNNLQRSTYRGDWTHPVPIIGRQGQEGRPPVIGR